MKNLPITFLSLFIIFSSCNDSSENLSSSVIQNENNFQEKSNFGQATNNQARDIIYMTSYLISRVLIEDEAAQNHFYRFGSGKSLKISLKNLLDTPDSPFEKAFRIRYDRFNWYINPEGEPTPPLSQAVPDPLENDYNILTLTYNDYIYIIQNLYNLEILLPNKEMLYNYDSFHDYFNDKDFIFNLWNYDAPIYNDGLKTSDNSANFISSDFDYLNTLNDYLILTLQNNPN